MNSKLPFVFLVLILLAVAGCGPNDEAQFLPGPSQDFEADVGPGERITLGEISPPEGETTFALITARPPAGATVIPMEAKLVSHADPSTTYTVSSVSVDRNRTWEGTPVEPGTYTLTWLDENGAPTNFTQRIEVNEFRAVYLAVGGIRVHPQSAAFPEATDIVALDYRIADATQTLKTVRADLNTIIHLPPAAWQWFGVAQQGPNLQPLLLDAGEDILSVAWGSIFLRSNIEAHLRNRTEASLLHSEMVVGTEYLLPVTPQNDGCYTYRLMTGPQHLPSGQTVQLCSDARAHYDR